MFKRLCEWWTTPRAPETSKPDIVEQLMSSDPYSLSPNQRRIYDEIKRMEDELEEAHDIISVSSLEAKVTDEVRAANPWLCHLYRTHSAFRKTADEGGTIEDCLMDTIAVLQDSLLAVTNWKNPKQESEKSNG
jgi:hypothetical protein